LIDIDIDIDINTVDEKVLMATNLVNMSFGPVTSEILRCICKGGDCT